MIVSPDADVEIPSAPLPGVTILILLAAGVAIPLSVVNCVGTLGGKLPAETALIIWLTFTSYCVY